MRRSCELSMWSAVDDVFVVYLVGEVVPVLHPVVVLVVQNTETSLNFLHVVD